MARITTKQADKILYDSLIPHIAQLSETLGYEVYVYWPGLDAPRKPDRTRVYVEVQRAILGKEPLGLQADSGFIATGQLTISLSATEKQDDYPKCSSAVEKLVEAFDRRRCGYDLVIHGARWEDTVVKDGRRVFNIMVDYEFET